MSSLNRSTIIALLATTILLLTVAPAMFVHSSISPAAPREKLHPVYANLESRVSISSLGYTSLVSVTFTLASPSNSTTFFSVGTFIPAGQCCPSSFLELISVDNGPPGAGQGLGCGGQTSQFTVTLNGVSCFGRLAFTPGTHTVSLVLYAGGPLTVERGPPTALLLEFD